MAVGMGIHGEAGHRRSRRAHRRRTRRTTGRASCSTSCPTDIDTADGARVGLILNGLGSVKHEELFVVYRGSLQLLTAPASTIVEPEVGEFGTSSTWPGSRSPCSGSTTNSRRSGPPPPHSPAYRKGTPSTPSTGRPPPSTRSTRAGTRTVGPSPPPATPPARPPEPASMYSRRSATPSTRTCSELGDIDAVAGDGDHGIGMQRGARAAVEAAAREHDRGAGAGAVLDRRRRCLGRPGGRHLWRAVGRGAARRRRRDRRRRQARRRTMSATASPRRCATFSRSARRRSATRRWSTCWFRSAPH